MKKYFNFKNFIILIILINIIRWPKIIENIIIEFGNMILRILGGIGT